MRSRVRAGFTLVELMVAMALTMFIMLILTQAFIISLETFSALKGIGDMQENLRNASITLRDDLSQDHFEGERRLSDPSLVLQKPEAGFFMVLQGSPLSANPVDPYVDEGPDAEGLRSQRATDHFLYMTAKRKGNRHGNFFTTSLRGDPLVLTPFFAQSTAYDVPPADLPHMTLTAPYTGGVEGQYSSQWAEVLYYLVRTGSTEEPNNPNDPPIGTPLYALKRAVFVMLPDPTNVNAVPFPNGTLSTFAGLSCMPGPTNLTFYSPADAATGGRVIPPGTAINPLRILPASTLVLPNVLSFQVQIMRADVQPPNFIDVPGGVYDTALFTQGSNDFGLKAIQVTLRVWDNATRQTRQLTIVQDL